MFSKTTMSGKAELDAINRSQAVIEFELDGTIITANENFLNVMGYDLSEVQGKHHSMFAEPGAASSPEYQQLWDGLRAGKFDAGEYKRLGKGGKEIWIQASYNPVFNGSGNPVRVIKFATDITKQKLVNAEFEGKINAISRSQAVIEFELDGTIITANENFLNTMGYELSEVQGKHHSMFAEAGVASTPEYQQLWDGLRAGKFDAGEYKRLGKGGKEIWIQASYNPIFDMNGRPFKVVKFATDVTEQKLASADASGQLDAIGKAQAVIEFELDGTIITANENFLDAMGYSLGEVQGQHHKIFMDPTEASSPEYQQFWEGLRNGQFESHVYKRIAKGGREVWIQASYNPIFDGCGKPFKVVKFASDMTKVIQVADLAEETTANVQNVAAAAEEMTASIREISNNMNASKQAVSDIIEKTEASGKATDQLIQGMESMETIVDLINNIAGQVNLLALNATIEAARAGDAGKGFAVVASEVKNLATQTAQATESISKEIASIQSVSNVVANSVKDIVGAASSVDSYVTGVASAIEEQSVVTQEISANTQRTSSAVSHIADEIKSLSNK